MDNIGRKEPCPCNSGKKYKDCHMRKFYPKENFKVKASSGSIANDYHLEQRVGTNEWVKVPGRLAFMIGYQEKNYEDIDNIINDLTDFVPNNRYIVSERIGRLKHKLYGIRYHLENFIDEENKIIKEFQSEYHAPDHNSIFHNPRLIYEIESFLFQIKSALDILAQIISIIFNLGIHRYSISESKLENQLTKKLKEHKKNDILKDELADIIIRNDRWIVDTIDMRDEITHTSDLQGFLCFMKYAWKGEEFAYISYPSMPDGQKATTYMQQTWQNLYQLIFDISPFLITKLKTVNVT